MRVAVASVQVPFIRGGAETLASGLVSALRNHGHEAELILMPFCFTPAKKVLRNMDMWATEDFSRFDCENIDAVICLKFPSLYLSHPRKIVWLMHQHRAVYDLWDTKYSCDISSSKESRLLKNEITKRDTHALMSACAVYTIAQNVSARMMQFNGVHSKPLYHPPANAGRFYSADMLPYIFFPSRLEGLKRQELLIRAMGLVKSPVSAIIAGEGGIKQHLEALLGELGLQNRVCLLGRIGGDEMLVWYANCLGVFFGPYDEDYGYVTLEAMLSAKPVITCTDSGGPLEFVVNNETGIVVDPSPQAIAEAIDLLYFNRMRSIDMGKAGLSRYHELGITWDRVVSTLLSEQ
jgi:glycosyltransferase involved in cell wall biosynthesis